MTSRQQSHILEQRAIREEVLKRKVFRQTFRVDPARKIWKCPKPLDLGREQQRTTDLGVVDRLDAKPIAGDRQSPLRVVPDREREHAVEAQQAVEAPLRERVQQNFAVAGRIEPVPERGKLDL